MIRTPLTALCLTAVLALSGCGSDIGQNGAAATVGDVHISTAQLRDLVARSLADPEAKQTIGADPVAFERTALRRLVSHLVVVAAAKSQGVTVDGSAVNATFDKFAQQTGGAAQLEAAALKQGIAKQDLQNEISDIALRDVLADKLTASLEVPESALQQAFTQNAAQYDQVRSAHILVATEAKARELLAKVQANPGSFADLAKQFSTDTGSKDKGGDLGYQGRGALEKNFENAIFDNPPGSFVIAKTQFGFHVIAVIDRRTTTFEQAKVELRRGLLTTQRQLAIETLLAKTAKRLGVEINPRFGTWDGATQQILAIPDCTATSVTSASPRPDDAGAAPAAEPSATPNCP